MHYRTCSSIPGLYSLDANRTDPQIVTTTNVPRHGQMSPRGQNHPRLRITAPDIIPADTGIEIWAEGMLWKRTDIPLRATYLWLSKQLTAQVRSSTHHSGCIYRVREIESYISRTGTKAKTGPGPGTPGPQLPLGPPPTTSSP